MLGTAGVKHRVGSSVFSDRLPVPQAEVIQRVLAPFGQTANRRNDLAARDDANLTQAFRRDYTLSVATQF